MNLRLNINRCNRRAVLAVYLLACMQSLAAQTTAAVGVIVAEAREVSFPLTVEALGTARANEALEIRPKISDVVTKIQFAEGEHVEAGAVLIELDNTQAIASVAQARATLVDSNSQFRRASELFESRAVSASEIEQLKARRDADRAALDAAEARLADTVIRAPFAGRLGLRRISLGTLVGPGTVVTTLDDTDPIKLDFNVPETAFARLFEGLPVIARSAAWPELEFRGEVSSIDTRVDPVSRTIIVRALIPNPEGQLRPGMFMSVRLLRDDVTALLIPEQALVPEQSRQFVFVVGENLLVEQREVQTGRRRPGAVEILEGLQAGEMVVAEGTQKVRTGSLIRVLEQIEVQP